MKNNKKYAIVMLAVAGFTVQNQISSSDKKSEIDTSARRSVKSLAKMFESTPADTKQAADMKKPLANKKVNSLNHEKSKLEKESFASYGDIKDMVKELLSTKDLSYVKSLFLDIAEYLKTSDNMDFLRIRANINTFKSGEFGQRSNFVQDILGELSRNSIEQARVIVDIINIELSYK